MYNINSYCKPCTRAFNALESCVQIQVQLQESMSTAKWVVSHMYNTKLYHYLLQTRTLRVCILHPYYLDISAQDFWDNRYLRAFFDVRPTLNHSLPQSTGSRRERNREITNRESVKSNSVHSLLMFSTSGGMAKCASVTYKRLTALLSTKRDQPYSLVIAWLRCHLSFSLLRSAITCLRGARHVPHLDVLCTTDHST